MQSRSLKYQIINVFMWHPAAAACRAAAAAAEGPTDCSLKTLQCCRAPYRGIHIQHSNAFLSMAPIRQDGDTLASTLAAAASCCACNTPGWPCCNNPGGGLSGGEREQDSARVFNMENDVRI